ncbi:unnamed protein product [Cuscuta epithymum]|uniref:Uncharacterized protein n=1 Tax=Cuscuta epithymum TaxID=186058 RepID=A0AAV0DCW0_9ASTE|nr:unnamed protein product [Cuscuta epithymum]
MGNSSWVDHWSNSDRMPTVSTPSIEQSPHVTGPSTSQNVEPPSEAGKSMDATYLAILPGFIVWQIWKNYWEIICKEVAPTKEGTLNQICKIKEAWCYAKLRMTILLGV